MFKILKSKVNFLLASLIIFFSFNFSFAVPIGCPPAGCIGYGDVSKETEFIQRLLELGNDKVNADGIYGSVTRQAVMDFQRQNGIYPDGIIGNQTIDKMSKVFTPEQIKKAATETYGTDDPEQIGNNIQQQGPPQPEQSPAASEPPEQINPGTKTGENVKDPGRAGETFNVPEDPFGQEFLSSVPNTSPDGGIDSMGLPESNGGIPNYGNLFNDAFQSTFGDFGRKMLSTVVPDMNFPESLKNSLQSLSESFQDSIYPDKSLNPTQGSPAGDGTPQDVQSGSLGGGSGIEGPGYGGSGVAPMGRDFSSPGISPGRAGSPGTTIPPPGTEPFPIGTDGKLDPALLDKLKVLSSEKLVEIEREADEFMKKVDEAGLTTEEIKEVARRFSEFCSSTSDPGCGESIIEDIKSRREEGDADPASDPETSEGSNTGQGTPPEQPQHGQGGGGGGGGQPQMPQMPQGGQGGGEQGGGDSNGNAKPEEGGQVSEVDKGKTYKCDKPQDATKCEKVPVTDIVDEKPLQGGPPTQLVCANGNCASADPGEKYTEVKTNLPNSPDAGKYYVQKAQLQQTPSGPKWKIQDGKPVLIRPGAVTPTKPITFI